MTSQPISTAPALPLDAGCWVLDPLHSSAGFTVRHLGIAKVRGRFTDLDAELVVGRTAEESVVTATVDLASVDTGIADRDAHVRSAEILDVERRPTMAFRSTRIRERGGDWSMEGELTIGDVTRTTTFAVEFGGVEEFIADGRRHAGFEASGELRRSDFGLVIDGPPVVGDAIRILLDVQFMAPE